MKNTKLQIGQMVIIEGKKWRVTEECDILLTFWASDEDGEELEFHHTMIEAFLPQKKIINAQKKASFYHEITI